MPLTADAVKAKALDLGFDLCGVAAVDAHPELAFFDDWIARGYAGEMHYLPETADLRRDVRNILPSARSVVVTATVYNTDRPYSTAVDDPDRARISRYAWGEDYHRVIGRRIDALDDWMHATHGTPFESRPHVDTGPVQERVFAQYGGLGWIGKNCCLISVTHGSWLFLAVIVCGLPLEADPPATEHCGSCTRCLDACPTDALVAPAVLDARRCLSYLTIELRGDVPEEFRAAMGSQIYGCDICQDVCPWNRTPLVSADPAWQPRAALDGVRLTALAARTDDELRRDLRGSPMKRAKISGLRRNLSIACENRRDSRSSPPGREGASVDDDRRRA
jgi:epoxyqueuosine reductase